MVQQNQEKSTHMYKYVDHSKHKGINGAMTKRVCRDFIYGNVLVSFMYLTSSDLKKEVIASYIHCMKCDRTGYTENYTPPTLVSIPGKGYGLVSTIGKQSIDVPVHTVRGTVAAH